jgi:acetyltransferase
VSALLKAYGIAATPVVQAPSPDDAAKVAEPFLRAGGACVVKLLSRDITHKSDVDGVRLNLASVEAVRSAAAEIMERARRLRPEARIDGIMVQPMIMRPKARELIAGVAIDPTFGPIILFGHGGTAVELINDQALSLLPLNIVQAHELIARTRVSRLLKGYRNVPAADADAVAEVLVRLSRLVEDLPEIAGLDLNPLLADETGCIAVDARVEIGPAMAGKALKDRFAVRPYPRELEAYVRLPSGLDLRFFNPRKTMDRALIARLTQLDYARDMAIVALNAADSAILGVVRLMGDANHDQAEYAILVRSDQQHKGLGLELMRRIIGFAHSEGYQSLAGPVLSENEKMLALCKELGFAIAAAGAPGVTMTSMRLHP